MSASEFWDRRDGSTAMKPKMLFVGDAVSSTGFAKATHHYLAAAVKDYDVTVLGINYFGDPHEYPYPIYPAFPGGDVFGVQRLLFMCDLVTKSVQDGQHRRRVPEAEYRKPDVIVLQNDAWNIPAYMERLKLKESDFKDVPVVGIIAIDGKNCRGDCLQDLSLAIFWTKFALDAARYGGYDGPAAVVPLGVDLDVYKPVDKVEARRRRNVPEGALRSFIVGNVNRNQPRKRLDLTLAAFAKWAGKGPLKDAYLYLHLAPTGDNGVDIVQLAHYYGIAGRVGCIQSHDFKGATEDEMRDTYNIFDVQISTTQGEGFGLTTLEGMACGVPQIVPAWSALGEWATAAARVPCISTAINFVAPSVNTLGGVADVDDMVSWLDKLYKDKQLRATMAHDGMALAYEDRYRWERIGSGFRLLVNAMLQEREEVPA